MDFMQLHTKKRLLMTSQIIANTGALVMIVISTYSIWIMLSALGLDSVSTPQSLVLILASKISGVGHYLVFGLGGLDYNTASLFMSYDVIWGNKL